MAATFPTTQELAFRPMQAPATDPAAPADTGSATKPRRKHMRTSGPPRSPNALERDRNIADLNASDFKEMPDIEKRHHLPNGCRPWTPEDVAILMEYRDKGVPYKQIRGLIRRTDQAMRLKDMHERQKRLGHNARVQKPARAQARKVARSLAPASTDAPSQSLVSPQCLPDSSVDLMAAPDPTANVTWRATSSYSQMPASKDDAAHSLITLSQSRTAAAGSQETASPRKTYAMLSEYQSSMTETYFAAQPTVAAQDELVSPRTSVVATCPAQASRESTAKETPSSASKMAAMPPLAPASTAMGSPSNASMMERTDSYQQGNAAEARSSTRKMRINSLLN